MKILLLEDVPEQYEAITAALHERGHSVVLAKTLFEAQMIVGGITAAASGGEALDLGAVFADHDMPWEEGGFDDGDTAGCVARLRESFPGLPIVAISAVPSNNQHLLAVGADVACEKGELLACMDEVLHRVTTILLAPTKAP